MSDFNLATSTPLGMGNGILHQLPDGRQFVSYPTTSIDAEYLENYKLGLSGGGLEEMQRSLDETT